MQSSNDVKENLADKICMKIFSYGTDLYKFALSSVLLTVHTLKITCTLIVNQANLATDL